VTFRADSRERPSDLPAKWRSAKLGCGNGRYWEHAIRDDADMARHVDYTHFNPVKHGHVTRVCDWPYSSFHRYVAQDILPLDWGGDTRDTPGEFGE
jgi:putative transposase